MQMTRITFTAEEEHESYLAEVEQRDDIDSTVAAVRYCIDTAEDAQRHDANLQQQIERLQNEKRMLIEDRQEKRKLIRYVEEERQIQHARQQRKSAPMWKRAKW